MDFFNDYSHTLEKEQQVRDEIRTQTRELSRVCREIESKCLKIQNQTDDEKGEPSVLSRSDPFLSSLCCDRKGEDTCAR